MDAEYDKDTYLNDIPKDRPLFGPVYMKKYLAEMDERVSKLSYDYDLVERRILERNLMTGFRVRPDPPPAASPEVVEAPKAPVTLSNPRSRKILF